MEPKERILIKANELYNRYGIRSVSMDDIAVQLGMSKKTLYQFYADKEELVSAVITTLLETNRERCICDRKRAENSIHEIFQAFDMMQDIFSRMNPAVVFDLEKYHPVVYSKFQDYRNNFLYELLSSNIESGIRDELYRPDIDVDVVTRYRIESVFLAFNTEIFPNNRTHLMHIEQQLLEIFMYGIATAKGQKLISKYKQQRIKKN